MVDADAASGFGGFCASAGFGGIESPPRAVSGFDDFGGKPAPAPVFEEAEKPRAAPTEKPARGAFGSGGPGVGRMLQTAMFDSVRARGVSPFSPSAAPAKDAPTAAPRTTAFGGFGVKSPDAALAATGSGGFGAKPTEATPTSSGFTGFDATKSTVAPAPTSAFAGFAANKSAAAPASSGFSGFGAAKSTVTPPPPQPVNTFTGFGTTKPAADAPAKPAEAPTTSGFSGFGAAKSTVVPPASAFAGFAAAKPTEPRPYLVSLDSEPRSLSTNTFTGFAANKSTAEAAVKPASGFAGFAAKPTEASTSSGVPASSGFTGFGATKPAAEVKPAEAPATSGFTGFGSTKPTEAPPAASSGFSGFGSIKKTVEPPNGALRKPAETGFSGFGATKTASGFGTVKSAAGTDRVQKDFGTLHVSGPAHVMAALAENERRRNGEREVKQEVVDPEEERREQPGKQRRVRFSDVEEREDGREVDVKREIKEEEEDVEDPKQVKQEESESEADDDAAFEPRFPWGKRPKFREMLAGGKKLVLADPPKGVSDFFMNKVFRSYGCTYDSPMNMFYATSPGQRARGDGAVVALRGSCSGQPIVVATGLVEPAAVAVFEPGLSVCTVTNKGIFVFTHQFDDQGAPTGSFLTRQISYKGFHRGIAATAGGGIVSFSNGRVRLFDGNVANGEERVLAEVSYDMVINNKLFADNPARRSEKSNCCFMDIVDNRLVMSDLQKHVISLWEIVDAGPQGAAQINFVRAADVAVSKEARGKVGLRGPLIPPGKCVYASGIRLDAEGWVMCADADGRTIQIYDDQLQFVSRVETTANQLPYISGLYVEEKGHLMVCDRKSEMGGLRVFMLETADEKNVKKEVVEPSKTTSSKSFGFAAAARLQGGNF